MTSQLYERAAELAAIDAAVGTLSTGRGSSVLLEARAGCGKSALVDRAIDAARAAGARVVLARARHLESASPFGVLRRLLGPAVEELGGPDALTGAARFAGPLFTPGAELTQGIDYGCQWLVARLAEQSPLLLAVDDAHWADAASLRVLLDVQAELSVQPVVLVLASRPVENAEAQRFLSAIAAQPDCAVLTPAPLSRDGVAEVVADVLGGLSDDAFVDECAQASGGNVFYLQELLRPFLHGTRPTTHALTGDGPVSLMRTLSWRLGELGTEAAQLAPAAAVLGDGCPLHVAAALAGLDDDAAVLQAARLEAASILRQGDPMEFVHPLIRAAVEASLPPVAVGELHARAARLLWTSGARPDDVVQHLLAAPGTGDTQVAEFLTEQGVAALETGSVDLAARLLTRALAEPAPVDRRDLLLVRLARAELARGDLDDASRHLETALESPQRSVGLVAAAELFDVLDSAGSQEERARLHQRVLEMRPYGETDAEVRLRSQLLVNAFMRIEPDLADLPAELAALDATTLQTDRSVDRYLLAAAAIFERTMRRGTTPRLEANLRRAVAAIPFADHVDYWDVRTALLAATLLADDALAESDALLAQVTPVVARLRGVAPDLQAELDHRRILNTMRRGGFEDALAEVAIAEDFSTRHRLAAYAGAHRYVRGWVALERGDHARAGAVLSERLFDDTVLPALGALLCGDARRALSMLDAFGFSSDPDAPVRQIEVELEPHLIASHACELVGDRDRAAVEARREVSIRRRYGARFRLAQALRRLSTFETARHALPLLEEAMDLAASTPRRPVQIRVAATYGAALRRVGDEGKAREVLYASLDGATELGMERVRARAEEQLRLAGGRPRRARRSGPRSLTDAQLQVATLAAAGLTNREIAEQLFVTIKTVETHLVAVYRKLGVPGREQLAASLAAAGDSRVVGV